MVVSPWTWENNPDANDAEPWLNVPCIEVEPVTPKLPVIKAEPVNGNVEGNVNKEPVPLYMEVPSVWRIRWYVSSIFWPVKSNGPGITFIYLFR